MKRGDIVTVALQGDYGEPRPAVIIQSDLVPPGDSILVCLMTSAVRKESAFRRHTVEVSPQTGLRIRSQIMVDKIIVVRRDKCGPAIGKLDAVSMRTLTGKLAVIIGVED